MDANTTLRTNFANGIISRSIQVRTDWAKHQSSIADGLNVIVSSSGGLVKRPGTRYLGDALDVTINGKKHPPILVKFEFSLGQTYCLEFGNYEMRFWIDDYLIEESPGVPYKITTPYSYEQIKLASYVQYKDVQFWTQWDLPIKKLTRGVSVTHTNWYWDDVIVDADVSVRAPQNVRFIIKGNNDTAYTVTAVENDVESRGGNEVVTVPDLTAKIPSWVPQKSGDKVQDFYSLVSWVEEFEPTSGDNENFPQIDKVYRELIRVTNDLDSYPRFLYWSPNDGTSPKAPYTAYTYPITSAVVDVASKLWGNRFSGAAYDWRETHRGLASVTYWAPNYDGRGVYLWSLGISIDGLFRMIPYYYWDFKSTGLLRSEGVGDWGRGNFNYESGVSGWGPVLAIGNSKDTWAYNGTVAFRNYLMRTLYDNLNMDEMLDATQKVVDSMLWSPLNKIAWDNVDNATNYRIYRRFLNDADHPHFYLLDTVSADTLEYVDEDIRETQADLNYSPKESGLEFNDPDSYPNTCSLYQQRFVVGSTKENPLLLGGSEPGIFNAFREAENPNDVTGAYRFELMSKTSNPIRHIIPLKTLYVLTEAGAFVSTVSGAMNRGNVNFNQEAYNGASDIRPVIIDRTAIYVPLNKQMINSLQYSFTDDAFVDDNMLFAAQDILEDGLIESTDFLRPIINLFVCTTSKGKILANTFIPKQEFNAWTRFDTDGFVHQVCSITNSQGYDDLYTVVERDGKFLIEKFEDLRITNNEPTMYNSLYLDSALSGEFENEVNVVGGLEHLEGREVWALADMAVQGPFTVDNGEITLNYPAKYVHVGLLYKTEIETLDLQPPNIEQARTTLSGTSRRRVYRVRAEVEKTGMLKWQLNKGQSYQYVFQTSDTLGEAPKIFTGSIDLSGSVGDNRSTVVKFISDQPLPMRVNSIVAEIMYAG